MATNSCIHEKYQDVFGGVENCNTKDGLEPIAIIGLAARLPQEATCPTAFWSMLQQGRSAMTEVPSDRFNIDSFYHPDGERLDTLNVRGGHFLMGDVSKFDAPFFSISRTEAESLDPQQRGLLECTYHLLENAGIPMERAGGTKTGVFVGCFAKEYDTLFSRDPELPPKYQASGTGSAMLSNRLSWFYNLKGPSMTLDTACSSSLNALHLACQSLREGESNMAVVAGCNVMLNPDSIMMSLSNLQFLSPDGLCYSFDHRANGYSRGEGFGAVLLKPLHKALEDNDTIRAVIRASGSNQDGRTPGLTQPSEDAQALLIQETYRRGKLDLKTTRFFEAHGTGTQIGDTTEAAAIHRVFKNVRSPEEPLIIGAVKSNIGHLEGASGLASIIKSVMVLENGVIPPNTCFEKPNPAIPVEKWNIKFPLECMPWPTDGLRRASVNSFGYGGSNAHVVLDDAYHYLKTRHLIGRHRTIPSRKPPDVSHRDTASIDRFKSRLVDSRPMHIAPKDCNYLKLHLPDYQSKTCVAKGSTIHGCLLMQQNKNQPVEANAIDPVHTERNGTTGFVSRSMRPSISSVKLLVWSAADEGGIGRLTQTIETHLSELKDNSQSLTPQYLDDLAYTLASKRSKLPWKSYTLIQGDNINGIQGSSSKPLRSSGQAPGILFVFTGQGAAWHGMGRELLRNHVFRSSLEWSDRILESLGCDWSLIEELQRDEKTSRLTEPEFSQPACTALQIALVVLLRYWNIRPAAVIGHSSGEIAAAFCAGILSHQDAVKVGYYRGVLSAELAADMSRRQETMMAVALSQQDVEGYIAHVVNSAMLSIACVNSPSNVTVSGDAEAIEALRCSLEKDGVFARKLNVDVAYHSPTMNCVSEKYLKLMGNLKKRRETFEEHSPPQMVSSVSGELVSTDEAACGQYWVDNMVSRVEFAQALSTLQHSNTIPAVHSVIEIGPTGALRRPILDTLTGVSYDSVLKTGRSAQETAMSLCGNLWCYGVPVKLNAVNNLIESEVTMLTDLPTYPFNHAHSFWYESRLSKNFRFRKQPRHELLGTPVIDWNPLEAKWRNVIDATSSPWIRDHGFNGSRLYPAAGMIIMAIEASRQLADDVRATIKGYRVKDITFSRALVIPDDQDILETEFYMRSREGDRSQWSEFRLCSLNNNEWVEHCRGTIIVECEQNDVEVDNGLEMNQLRQRLLENSARVARNCNVQVGSKQMYHNLGTFGFDFGPTFQTLHDVSFNKGGEATATIHLNAWRDKVPPRTARIQEHIIHPTDLDGLLHLTVTAISRGGWKPIPTMVPTYLHELWISNEFLLDPKIKSMVISSRSMSKGLREAEFEMIACDPSRNQVLISIDRYRATAISSLGVLSKATPWRRLCFRPQWKMDIDTAGHEVVSRYCNDMADAVVASLGDAVQEAEFACLFFMSNVLLDGNTLDGVPSDSHLRKYCNWMRQHLSRADTQALWQSPDMQRLCGDGEYRQSFMSRVKESGPEGEVYAAVGKQLSSIMRGEIDVLDMLFKDNLLQNFYSGDAFTANYERMRAYTELLAHKNPNMRVLEIGAGTGGATEGILRALAPPEPSDKNSTPRYHEYVYTDISAGFFENAKTRFDQHAARLSFQTLDIEKDPMKQGFESAKYDLIVASCVLHATSEIDTTLKHTRSLLKPGGKLLLFEPCRLECARIPFVFGLLPGWWLSKESNREWSPLLSDTAWHDALLRNGFSGTEICLRDGEDDRHTFSVMVSSATSTPTTDLSLRAQVHTPIITINPDSLQQVIIADRLSDILGARGWPEPTVVPFTDLKHLELDSAICISLLEIDEPFLHRINEEEFLVLQRIVPSLSLMLWVSNERSRLSRDPLMGIATGFGRSMCSEHETMNFVTLLIEDDLSSQMIGDNIYTILQASAEMSCEQEYRYVDGQIQINRIVETNKINDNVHYRTVVQEPELRPFGQEPRRALTLTTSSPGLLSSLQFIDDPEQRSLGSEEVEIEVKAVGINFKNVMVALGQIPDTSLGQECSGIVTRLGSGILADRLRVNDRVCCLTKDGFKTFARCHISSLYKLPSDMSFATAAAIPVAFCTAYYSLIYLARLMPDESVLIHAAAGGVGQAAIQIAQSKGAEIFATVGSDEKKALLMDLYAIPEDHIFSSRHVSFEKGVKRMTSGRGVDVVLNSLSGELLKLSVDCVAPLGRFVEIGKKDMYLRNDISMTPFLNNIAFFSVDLGIIAEKAKPLMQEIMTSAMRLYTDESGYMQPPQPLTKFAVSHVEEAFRSLQSGKNSGKAIVELGMDDIVPTVPSFNPSWSFAPDATYVVAGGTGGLGRSIARWMVTRGAKNLILLSRSGTREKVARDLIEELSVDGTTVVAPSCDISDTDALKTVVAGYSETLPPIRGCIQGSMVLRDGLFSNMTHEHFHAALMPKVQGTWNLHNILPSGMDFFILLSSTGGVFGSRGQSNYAAASTYQDAFARHRTEQGEKCISLDLGLMLAVGFAAERQDITDSLRRAGYEGIHEAEFHAMLDDVCDPNLPIQAPDNTQIITGIATPESLAARGLDEIFWMTKPIFKGLRQMDREFKTLRTQRDRGTDYRYLLEQAQSQKAAGQIIADALRNKLSVALSMPSADIEVEKPTYAYGVDSLVAVEIRYWFLKEFNAHVTVFEIIGSESIAGLCLAVASRTHSIASK